MSRQIQSAIPLFDYRNESRVVIVNICTDFKTKWRWCDRKSLFPCFQ